MSDAIVNAKQLDGWRIERGVSVIWFSKYLGMGRTATYALFQDGLLPKDPEMKKAVLEKLAAYFGAEVPLIPLRLEAKETA
jgi:hypothetical protein